MERKTFLEMCQRCAVISGEIPKELLIYHAGVPYYPESLVVSFDKEGRTVNTAVLHSLSANSIIYKGLSDLDK